jgi:hypothetical protein
MMRSAAAEQFKSFRGTPMDELDAQVDKLQGSPEAKRRAKIVLRSILGYIPDVEACHSLCVSQSELEQLRRDALAGLLEGLMPTQGDPTAN